MAGDLCTKAGERKTRQKSVSLPPKAGELASLQFCAEVDSILTPTQNAPVEPVMKKMSIKFHHQEAQIIPCSMMFILAIRCNRQ